VRVLDARASVLRAALAVLDAGERAAMMAVLEKVLAAVTTSRDHAEQICRLCDVGACPQRTCPVELAAAEPRQGAGPAPRPIARRQAQ
jgi:MarR family transcriptional regulator, negative regulator of the multidrug operon emrRAB